MKDTVKYIYKDKVYSIEGALSVDDNSEYTQPWRIDYDRKELFPYLNDEFQGGACSGVRIAFTSDTTYLAIDIKKVYKNDTGEHMVMKLDLVVNSILIETLNINEGIKIYEFKKLEEGNKEIEIWLDHAFPVKFKAIYIKKDAYIKKTINNKKRWVHYGSSISHSVRGKSPSIIWPALVALDKNLHVTNLGFGGNCILEPIMGNSISELKADLFTLKLGINIIGGKLSDRSFEPCVIGLIESIRRQHKKTNIIIISPIYAKEHEDTRGLSNLTLVEIREILKQLVNKYNKLGDKNIYYVDGKSILGEKDRKYMPDEVHPNQEGQYVMAKNFIDKVINKYLF